jgi:plasmid segregation protein ParM
LDIVGLDVGFGFTKILKGRETCVFKSVYGDATEVQYRENIIGDTAKVDHLHLEMEEGDFFVGELAERQSVDRFFTLDQNDFVARFVKVLALAGLSTLVERNEPVRMVTGLPVSQFNRHKKRIARILTAAHDFTLVDTEENRRDTVVRIQDARVVPQPFGTVMDLMLNDIGEVRDTRFLNQKFGIIDIGFRTCDLTISDKAHYSERGSATTDYGISRAFNSIAHKIDQTTGVQVELYRLYDAVDRGSIKIRGREIEIAPLVNAAFTQLAKVIANEVNRLWADDWDLDEIILTGGGGKVLAPFLAPQIIGEVRAVDQGVDLRFNNVRGYHKYAMRLWSRGQRIAQQAASA